MFHGGIGPPWELLIDIYIYKCKSVYVIYILFVFCTLSLILSLLTMPKHGDMCFLSGECVTIMVFQGIQDCYCYIVEY